METESETEQEKNKYFTETEITVDTELIQIFISCSPRLSKNVIGKISKTNGLRHSTNDKRRTEILRGQKNLSKLDVQHIPQATKQMSQSRTTRATQDSEGHCGRSEVMKR